MRPITVFVGLEGHPPRRVIHLRSLVAGFELYLE